MTRKLTTTHYRKIDITIIEETADEETLYGWQIGNKEMSPFAIYRSSAVTNAQSYIDKNIRTIR